MTPKIFCCYAHEDWEYLNRLQKHLTPLRRQGLIVFWSDLNISVGTEWENEIKAQLSTAQIILLLISPDFMASDYCYGIEMKQALERHKRGDALVIPIILRPTLWEQSPFSQLQVLPTHAQPIESWPSQDAAFLDVVKGIHQAISQGLPSSQRAQKEACTPRIKVTPDFILATTDRLLGWFPPQSDALVLIDQVEVRTSGGPDGPSSTAVSGNRVAIWKISVDQSLATFAASQIKHIHETVWSPDGSRIALVGTSDQCGGYTYSGPYWLEIWEPETGNNSLYTASQIKHIRETVWSPDGSRIALMGEHEPHGRYQRSVEVWEPETESSSLVWAAESSHDGFGISSDGFDISSNIAWSPNSQQVAFITKNRLQPTNNNKLYIWDWTSRSFSVNVTLLEDDPDALAWSPNGDYLLLASRKMIQLRDAQSGLISHRDNYQHHPLTWRTPDDLQWCSYTLEWLDDSRFALATYENIWIQDISIEDTMLEKSFRGGQYLWSYDHSSLAILKDQGREVNVYDLETGQCAEVYKGGLSSVSVFTWSPDNSCLAVGCKNGEVLIWSRVTAQILLIYRVHIKSVSTIAWSPDSKYIASTTTNSHWFAEDIIHVWASQTTEPIAREPVTLHVVRPTSERAPIPEILPTISGSQWGSRSKAHSDVTEDICNTTTTEHASRDLSVPLPAKNAIVTKLVQMRTLFFSRPRKARMRRTDLAFSDLWLCILIIRLGACTLCGEILGGMLFHNAFAGLVVGFFFGLLF